jgi:aryl-alcohol dehydrogenase-like predicted oxidoreductase
MAWLKDHITEERIAKVRMLEDVADQLGMTTAQLAIVWLLRRKEVSSVISGATKVSQLNENLAASDRTDDLSNEILEEIEAILNNDPADE